MVILRDVTDRTEAEETLAQLLVERSRVAAALQQSLVPGELPQFPGMEIVVGTCRLGRTRDRR